MVKGQAQVHHPADSDGVVDDCRPLLRRFGGHNRRLRIVDDGAAEDAAQGAGVVDGESSALHVVQHQAARARPARQVGDGVGQAGDAQAVGVVNHRDHQAGGRGHGDAQVDAPFQHDAVVIPGGVERRVVFQRGGGGFQGERQVGQADALPMAESIPLAVPQADQAGDVHLYHTPGVGNLSGRPRHSVGNHPADGG